MSKSTQELMLNALKEIKTLKRELAGYKKAAHETIAIVGMGCRLPGGSINPDAFWDNLYNGVDCITQQENDERWNMDDLYDPDPDAPGKMYTKALGMIDDPDCFDADFFGISPREAKDIDPQHRLLLEVCHEAMETAGYAPGSLNGTRTGVFVGIASADYAHLGSILGSAEKLTPWQGIGNAMSAVAGRVSYLYNFKGPALAVDTACSSSLTAFHYACQSLRAGECDTALTGGVNLVLNPAISIVFSKARMLAADGHCKTFDASADGYARSEGCGIVMLKRLSDAERDGDNILAIVKGTAINQDGKSQGFVAPNESAQEDVIRSALKNADLEPQDVSYIEAHGTGTPLGDPIELGALNTVYCAGQTRSHPLLVGSVKTNVGHGEAAAGSAGLIKLIQSLRHRTIPPHINYKTPNPYIPWNKMAVKITDQLTDWDQYKPADGKLRAGLSGFAFTGTNVHVILEEYVPKAKKVEEEPAPEPWVPKLVLASAKQWISVGQWQEAMQHTLEQQTQEQRADLSLDSIARTCAAGRDHYKCRTAFLPKDLEDLQQLMQVKTGQTPSVLRGVKAKPSYKVAFLFSGQGAQFEGMGQAMYEHVPAFRHHFQQVADLLNPLLDAPLDSIMWGEESDKLNHTNYTQPALFALEYALAKTWMQWGIKADVLAGHSVGEIAAATIAGVFSLKDACILVAARSRLMAKTELGAMTVVFTSEQQTQEWIADHPGLQICAMNGPLNTVVGGKPELVEAFESSLKQQDIQFMRLPVRHAFHTDAMEPILEEFAQELQQIKFQNPRLRVLSNLTGEHVGKRMATVDYWVQQLRQPLNFLACAKGLLDAKVDVAIEIGPGAALVSMVRDTYDEISKQNQDEDKALNPLVSVANMQKSMSGLDSLTLSMAQLYVAGLDLDWQQIIPVKQVTPVHLPTYRYQRESIWNDTLRDYYQRQELPDKAKDWLYQLRWDAATTPLDELPVEQGSWLLLLPAYSLAQPFQTQLEQSGASVNVGCYQLQSDGVVLDLDQKQETWSTEGSSDISELLSQALNSGSCSESQGAPIKLVLSTAQLNGFSGSDNYQGMIASLTQLMLTVAKTVQQAQNVELYLITQSATALDNQSTEVVVEQSMVLGFAKNLALELADKMRCALDLESWDSSNIEHCIKLFSQQGNDPWLCLRDGKVMNPSLTRVLPESLSNRQHKLRDDSFYVIAGGTGSLGIAIAQWMVKLGARHIALLSRSGLRDDVKPAIEELQEQGAQIVVPEVDITDRSALKGALSLLRAENPIKGLVHAAGLFELCPVQELTVDRCTNLMNNKVLGIQWLDQLTDEDDLDFFVAYSSIASVWGSAGNFHYSAANQVVDAVIQRRRQQGKTALALNWGPWAESGMVTGESAEQAEKRGLLQMDKAIGTQVFGRLINSDRTQVVVADVVWKRFKPLMEITPAGALLRTVDDVVSMDDMASGEVELNADDLAFKEEFANCPEAEREERLLIYLKQQLAKALQMTPEAVDDTQPLIDMGIDSLLAVEFKNRVTKVTEVELPVVRMLGGANLSDVARWMAEGYSEQLNQDTTADEDEEDVVEGVL